MMNKKIIMIVGVLFFMSLVIALPILRESMDLGIELSSRDRETIEDKGITNITYSDSLDYETGVRIITHNKKGGDTFNFIKEIEIRPYTDECVSWNISYWDSEGLFYSSFENSPDLPQNTMGGNFCVSNPRVNKTSQEMEDEYEVLVKEAFEDFAEVERVRDLRDSRVPVRTGNIGLT